MLGNGWEYKAVSVAGAWITHIRPGTWVLVSSTNEHLEDVLGFPGLETSSTDRRRPSFGDYLEETISHLPKLVGGSAGIEILGE